MSAEGASEPATQHLTVHYHLPAPQAAAGRLVIGWIWLAVLALAGAGLFSLLLVLSRAPVIGEVLPWVDFFRSALVVHVNLSVLVWSLSFVAVLWTYNTTPNLVALGWTGLASSAAGAVAICLAPFSDAAEPLMSNYVPVLQVTPFYVGLALFGAGIIVTLLRCVIAGPLLTSTLDGVNVVRLALLLLAISVAVAAVAVGLSWLELSDQLAPLLYYEMLFWGGGHALQFAYTLALFVCWLWLASRAGIRLPLVPAGVFVLVLLAFLPVLWIPKMYLTLEVTSGAFVGGLTDLMKWGGAIAIVPMMAALFVALLYSKPESEEVGVYHTGLLTSSILFGVGGVIGFAISGSNVTVPAHYHGSTVGVTVAFMAVCYEVLGRAGYGAIGYRLARIQLWTYTTGQLMHIVGLVWSGGYGVQRKVAGSEQALDTIERVAGMGLMGLGGLVAAVGGLLFIIICLRALVTGRDHTRQEAREES